ncbi:hypothetical protein CYMTET_44886 [Cymbomonas tetramitiformis]|uniref:Uncharacterized protein n=1 Tax=Cymbomonas tetramitiformis TaxID=36881 RepID=A0AAE0BZB0_9CHLO|nr:hypothetical protein CYMTET_44886 [Cymbomonas tetramitiformis]
MRGKRVADRLSQDKDLDDWRLNRQWFEWADAEWHKRTVARFANELSTLLPWYHAQWYDPGCKGMDSLAYYWLGEVNWSAGGLLSSSSKRLPALAKPQPKLAPGSRVEVYWPIDDALYPGEMGDTNEYDMARASYEDGRAERLNMNEEKYRVLPPTEGERVDEWDTALEEGAPSRMPACSPTCRSAINNYNEDMGYDGLAKGRSACAYVVFAFVTFGRPDTVVSMQKSHIAVADDAISVVLHTEKGRRHIHLKRRLAIPAAGVEGLVLLLEQWQRARDGFW